MLKPHSLCSMLFSLSLVANKRKKYIYGWMMIMQKHEEWIDWMYLVKVWESVSFPPELMIWCVFLWKWANCATEEKCIYGQTCKHDIYVKRKRKRRFTA